MYSRPRWTSTILVTRGSTVGIRRSVPSTFRMPRALADTVARVVPFWEEVVLPELRSGQNALVVAHGGSLRALIRHVCGVSEDEVKELAIPTGKPFLLELDGQMRLSRQRWL